MCVRVCVCVGGGGGGSWCFAVPTCSTMHVAGWRSDYQPHCLLSSPVLRSEQVR